MKDHIRLLLHLNCWFVFLLAIYKYSGNTYTAVPLEKDFSHMRGNSLILLCRRFLLALITCNHIESKTENPPRLSIHIANSIDYLRQKVFHRNTDNIYRKNPGHRKNISSCISVAVMFLQTNASNLKKSYASKRRIRT